jgi:hypothetical protein
LKRYGIYFLKKMEMAMPFLGGKKEKKPIVSLPDSNDLSVDSSDT